MKNFSLFPTLLTELNNKGKNALISSVFKFCFLVLKLWLMMREMVRLQAFSRGKKKVPSKQPNRTETGGNNNVQNN